LFLLGHWGRNADYRNNQGGWGGRGAADDSNGIGKAIPGWKAAGVVRDLMQSVRFQAFSFPRIPWVGFGPDRGSTKALEVFKSTYNRFILNDSVGFDVSS